MWMIERAVKHQKSLLTEVIVKTDNINIWSKIAGFTFLDFWIECLPFS